MARRQIGAQRITDMTPPAFRTATPVRVVDAATMWTMVVINKTLGLEDLLTLGIGGAVHPQCQRGILLLAAAMNLPLASDLPAYAVRSYEARELKPAAVIINHGNFPLVKPDKLHIARSVCVNHADR